MIDCKVFKNDTLANCELSIKRLYLPFTILWQCPQCGHKNELNLEHDYISDPPVGCKYDEMVVCWECGHEDTVKLIINVEVKPG